MAAITVKCTWFMRNSQGGFSESLLYLTSPDLDGAAAAALTLGKARVAILGLGAQLDGIRVSAQPPAKKASYLVDLSGQGKGNAPIIADSTITGYSDVTNRAPDVLQSSLLLQCLNNTTGQKKAWYLGGVPDIIMRADPTGPDFSTSAVWWNKFQIWRNLVQNVAGNWGFRARNTSLVKDTINSWALFAGPNTLLGVVLAQGAPTYTVGQQVQIQGVTVASKAYKKPLGIWNIDSILNPSPGTGFITYFLTNSAGINPANFIKKGTMQAVAYVGLPITDVNIQKEVGHKRGKYFGQFRGRVTKPARV